MGALWAIQQSVAMVRTRMPGGVGGKACEGLPIPMCARHGA